MRCPLCWRPSCDHAQPYDCRRSLGSIFAGEWWAWSPGVWAAMTWPG